MQLLLLLLCAPLAMGACPKMLEGVPKRKYGWSHEIFSGIDVACGRKMFTSEFYSRKTVEELMKLMAADAIVKNATICAAECIKALDERYHIRALTPLAQSMRASFDAMNNAEAKSHIVAFYNLSYTYRLQERTAPEFWGDLLHRMHESDDKNDLVFPRSAEAEMAIVRAMKRGFGIEDSVLQRSENIATAMNALRNAKLPRDAAEISALIKNTQEVIERLRSKYTPGYFRGAFNIFADDVKNEWIRAVEILPGAETLFLQYLKLDNKEAKSFIDSFLKSQKEQYENSEPTIQKSNRKHKQTTSDLGLSEDAALALESTFPELFQYLYKNEYIVKKSLGNF